MDQEEEQKITTTTTTPNTATTTEATSRRIPLNDQLFQQALERYIDDNKPDPLALKQLQEWKLEWSEEDDDDDEEEKDNINDAITTELPNFDPTHNNMMIRGTLQIHGEYIIVSLKCLCAWAPSPEKASFGSLYYVCTVSAEFVSVTKKDKIKSKIISRLRQDDYISSIMTVNDNKNKQQSKKGEKDASSSSSCQILAQAKIQVDAQHLEERVHVSEQLCEAVKRAVWSSAETPLDVIELILNLPSLPCMLSPTSSPITMTPLANRAKLRLLEDAMVDACEQEGEGEIIGDLKISEETTATTATGNEQDDDDDDDGGAIVQKKKKKRSK